MAIVPGGAPTSIRAYDLAVVYTAPLGTAAPTDTTTALNVAFVPLGLLSEDGVTRTMNVDRTELKSLGGNVVRAKRTSQGVQYKFTILENIHEAFLRANPGSTDVTTTGITTRTYKLHVAAPRAMVIHCTEGSIATRFWMPNAELFSDGDQKLAPTDMAGKDMTTYIYGDSAGIFHYEITDDPAAAAS